MKISLPALPQITKDNSDGDPAYESAKEFMLHSHGIAGKEYGWLWDYSKELWKHRNAVFAELDAKADNIIKYLGGGTGLFALGFIARTDASNAYLVCWSLPSILTALASVFLATLARMPSGVPSIPTVAQAKIEYADQEDDEGKAKAAFLGQWHLACEDMRLACLRKSRFVEWATLGYFVAICLLVLPLFALTMPLLNAGIPRP